jgi:hypothetical protein
MPGIGIDPRTGQIIVVPGGGPSGDWGPSESARNRADRNLSRARGEITWERNWEEWQRSDASWIERLIEDYYREKERAQAQAKKEAALSLAFGNPYMAMVVAETGVNPGLLLDSPAAFSEVAYLAFLKYQQDVKRAWQEGKGPLRPLTAKEFVSQLISSAVGEDFGFIIGLTGSQNEPFTPVQILGPHPELSFDGPRFGSVPVGWYGTGNVLMWGPGVTGNYGVMPIEEAYALQDLLLTARRFFPWATDEAWWAGDPDYLAFNPDAAAGYGKLSEAPPGWEQQGEGIYQDPTTGFLYFSETGAYLGHGFLSTWQQNSSLLGVPLTNEFSKDGKVYQVFQGGVLSWDPGTGKITIHGSLEEAGLGSGGIPLASPLYWTKSGKAVSPEEALAKGDNKSWVIDPYIGKGSSYYDTHPAQKLLPEKAPSSYPVFGFPESDVTVNPKAVWVKGSGGQFQEPDPWIRDRFLSKIRTDKKLKNWYYSLSDLEKNQVFANFILTGEIYL